MSGIAGYWGFSRDKTTLEAMHNALHTGGKKPNFYMGEFAGLVAEHVLASPDKTYVLIATGEVYNAPEIRQKLEVKGHEFTTSETVEALLHAYIDEGVAGLDMCKGSFAAAILNTAKHELILVRDQLGGKPLYVANSGTLAKPRIAFATCATSLLATHQVQAKPNDACVYEYLKNGNLPANTDTFFKGIEQLLPGEVITINKQGLRRGVYTTFPDELTQRALKPENDAPNALGEHRVRFVKALQSVLQTNKKVGVVTNNPYNSSLVEEIAELTDSPIDVVSPSFQGMTQKPGGGATSENPGKISKVNVHEVILSADDFAADLEDFVRQQEEPVLSVDSYVYSKLVREAASQHSVVVSDNAIAQFSTDKYRPMYWRELQHKKAYMTLAYEMLRVPKLLSRFVWWYLTCRFGLRKVAGVVDMLAVAFVRVNRKKHSGAHAHTASQHFADDILHKLPGVLQSEAKSLAASSSVVRQPFLDLSVLLHLAGTSSGSLVNIFEATSQKSSTAESEGWEDAWFRRLKTRFYGIFLSESFATRPYFNQQVVLNNFEQYIKGKGDFSSSVFWRFLNVELWLREFFDEKVAEEVPKAKDTFAPNADKQLDITVGMQTYRRYPIQTKAVVASEKLVPFVTNYVDNFFEELGKSKAHGAYIQKPWRLFISEKIVAITQGRSYFIWDIKPSFWARMLSRFVVKTPYGIGLGSPWTMQLAIDEAGLPRIMFAAVGAIVGKALGKRGWFYNLAGANVRAIDGPTEYSVYPSNVSAKLPPKDPAIVAQQLTDAIRKRLPAKAVAYFEGVVVIDANDLGRNVLGHNTDQTEADLEAVFADNPLGQGSERTPLCVVFKG